MRTVDTGGKCAQRGPDETFREEQTKEGFSPARERRTGECCLGGMVLELTQKRQH